MTKRDEESQVTAEAVLKRISAEIAKRLVDGQQVDIEEYAAQYPEWADLIRQMYPGLTGAQESNGEWDRLADPAAANTRVIGDFRLIRQIGRGGMGIVYEAQQISLQRRVALKVLPFAAVLDPRQLQRFKFEAQAAAGLHHPHIVPVHSVGTDRGVHYYAMQYVDGQNLATILKQIRLANVNAEISDLPPATRAADTKPYPDESDCDIVFDPQAGIAATENAVSTAETENVAQDTAPFRLHPHTIDSLNDKRQRYRTIARLGVEAADALEYAHERGIIHRDIKPSNLLIDEVGTLWVTDFGLAQMETEAGLTMTGDLMGTLQYMSPEQALGHRELVDRRSDVYSLGVTLYELITCRPMMPSMKNKAALLQRIANEEPPPPSRINRNVPADLETIVLKAICKDPSSRYLSAGELAADLRRYLDHKPILAKRPGTWDRLTKWSRRNHTIMAAVAAVAVVAVVALSVSMFFVARAYRTADAERKRAEMEAKRADINLTRALQSVNGMLTDVASDEFAHIPGMEPARRALLQKAIHLLERLVADQDELPIVQFETAKAYSKIAEIHEALGDFREAEVTGKRAIAILNQLIEGDPQRFDYRDTLTRAYENVGLALFQQRPLRIDDAVAMCEQQLLETKRLVDDFPYDLRIRRRLAEVHTDLGNFNWEAGRRVEAESHLWRGAKIWDAIILEHPHLRDAADHAHARQWLGGMLMRTKRFEPAERELVKANQIYEHLVATEPDNAEWRGRLAHNRSYLGDLYFRRGEFSRSAEYRRKATELREALYQEYPHVYEHQRRLVVCYFDLMLSCAKEKKYDEARELIDKRHQLILEFERSYPQAPRKPGRFAWAVYELGKLMFEQGDLEGAREQFQRAHDYFVQDAVEFPTQFKAQHWLSWFLVSCPLVEFRDHLRARDPARHALDLKPDDPDAIGVLGVVEYRHDNLSGAAAALKEAMRLPLSPATAVAQYLQAMIDWREGRHDRARRRYVDTAGWQAEQIRVEPEVELLRIEAAELLELDPSED